MDDDAITQQLADQSQPDLVDFDLLSAPGHLLRRNHQRSYELFTKRVGPTVTRQQFALLLSLAQRPGASQRDLVDATGMDKSTLKEMLERMVARGWVLRERDPSDSRAWTMLMTAQGRELLNELIPLVAGVQRDILAPLAEEDRPVFMRLLRTLLGFEERAVQ
ncbi:MAG TPA: MarR family winged helix-turn-helix transcriptional regulator [Sphingomonas sp.]|uniref:MarR family winged helix-turn-helix transcriptional regulator n=1 Tax=Sphingomonas sp. TaxID=28214 RepID=UPI002CEE91CA|nr:MarR family winged helix-turn-helix transcriptional regulator [Sphingomonas sp.]HMI20610.1 MarR family winged helix-turn-helix transcriptional regulator [Sphingomonas sp.]